MNLTKGSASRRSDTQLQRRSGQGALRAMLAFALVLFAALAAFGVGYIATVGSTEAQAAPVGRKNEQACDNCDKIIANPPQVPIYDPDGDGQGDPYVDVLDNGKVYRGGNSVSGTGDFQLDKDPTDFNNVLPYGDTYIDVSKLTWAASNSRNYIIDIKDTTHFKWIASTDTANGVYDANNNTPTSDPLGNEAGMELGKGPIIAFVGESVGYLDDTTVETDDRYWTKPSQTSGNTNEIEAEKGSYLYRITYKDAVTLKDGTRGDLMLTVTRFEFETTLTVDSKHPNPDNGYTKMVVGIQGANEMRVEPQFKDKNGAAFNQSDVVIRTASEVATMMSGVPGWESDWNTDKTMRAGTGVLIDLDIEVVDADGKPVTGSIAYATSDLDFETWQDHWGRSVQDPSTRSKFAEGMAIVDGSLSYAVVPTYNEAYDSATTRSTGWVPAAPGESHAAPLMVTETQSTGSGKADGTRFSSTGYVSMRDKNGTFVDALMNDKDAMTTLLGYAPQNAKGQINSREYAGQTIPNYVKIQLHNKIKDDQGTPIALDDLTRQQIIDYIGSGSISTVRNDHIGDDYRSFDTGFAVLLNAEKSSLRWSGSRINSANIGSVLFDASVYTYIKVSHGTGGGIYFETYDITDECKNIRNEGTTIMGRGGQAVATVVPEDGYRVKTITVGDEKLATSTTYTIAALSFTDGVYKDADNGLSIVDNGDGTYDVVFANIQVPRHVHVDFATDFFFHKVWKGDGVKTGVKTTDLTLTATPYVYEDGAFVQKGDSVTFALTQADAEDTDEANVVETTDTDGNKVWNVTYPSEGYTTADGKVWPALDVEVEPAAHNVNHVERIYWFVTETVPEGYEESYSNDGAEAPGKISEAEGRKEIYQEKDSGDLSNWAEAAVKDYEGVTDALPAQAEDDLAFMSVFNTNDDADYAWGGEIANEVKPPVPHDDESWGLRGEKQTGEPTFDEGSSEIETIQLIDPETGLATNAKTVNALDKDGNVIGTYTLNGDGTITFTPDEDFVGDPQPCQLLATDKMGNSVVGKYQPHVIDDTETDTVSRTINYIYSTDGSEAAASVTQTATFTRKATGIDPETHEPIWGDWELTENTLDPVDSPEIEGWTPSSESVPGFDTLTYDQKDEVKDLTIVYSPEPPEGSHKTSFGPKGAVQKGTPPFTEGTGEIEKYELIDEEGNVVDELPAYDKDGKQVGTYTIDTETGEVTFTPSDPDFVGTPTPATVRATDSLGETATGTYTPTTVDNVQTETVKKTITHVYEDGSPVLDDEGNPLVTVFELEFVREAEVDPETGEMTWPNWESKTFDDHDAPDVPGYSPDKAASKGETVSGDDDDIEDKIVYKKDAYTVTYLDGDHGKSDGAGDETGVPYGDMVKGGNGVTPDTGYKFTGKYTYTITQKDGTVLTGETDDPTSVEVTGDVVFTPVYEPLPWVTYIDPATGRTIMVKTPFDGDEPPAPADPTRDGYTFAGWDREVDEFGNITYKAKWEPAEQTIWVTYIDPATGRVIKEKTSFTKGSPEPAAPADPTRDGYVFAGWDRSVDAEGNITYRAKWTPATPAPGGKPDPKNVIPNTGDEFSVWAVALLALAGLGAMAVSRRKRA